MASYKRLDNGKYLDLQTGRVFDSIPRPNVDPRAQAEQVRLALCEGQRLYIENGKRFYAPGCNYKVEEVAAILRKYPDWGLD